MKVLLLTTHFSPNVGGVETHLDDLVKALTKKGFEIFVLSYRPLTTHARWKIFEKNGIVTIFRIPWIPYLFYKFVPHPTLEFIYLFPGLFILTPLIILLKNPDVVYAHGIVAGSVGVFWGKIFRKKVVISMHSIYHFPRRRLYTSFVRLVLKLVDCVMCLSKQSAKEVENLGILKKKIKVFTYWIDLDRFKKDNEAKEKLDWNGKFIVLFVGRLIPEKGILELLKSVKSWNKNITLVIIGSGPLEDFINTQKKLIKNLIFLGEIDNKRLPLYYSAADLLIVPSVHEEGFGRVILESLACGTPVIGSKRGAIPEAMNSNVGKLIDISPEIITKEVNSFFINRKILSKMGINARKFAESNYSERNVDVIINNLRK